MGVHFITFIVLSTSFRKRDELENLLRNISMEREKIKATMVWCMDNSESADEVLLWTTVLIQHCSL